MEILGKTVSANAAEHIEAIEATLKKPVIYKFTDPQVTPNYGQCDPWQKDSYYVYSKEALFNCAKKKQVNVPFETNLLHELSHLCQIEEAFPSTATVYNHLTLQNQALYDKIGSIVCSSVLDLNVDFRLKGMGYTSEYFYQSRIRSAEKIFRKINNQNEITDVDFILYVCQLMCLQISYSGEDLDHLMGTCHVKFPAIYNCVEYLSANIAQIGTADKFSAFRCLVFLFDTFNLWISHCICYEGLEFRSMAAVMESYPDIRTWEAPPQA